MSDQPKTDAERSQLENKSRLLLASAVLAAVAMFAMAMSLWLTLEPGRAFSLGRMLSGGAIAMSALVIVLNLLAYRRIRKQL